MAIRKPSFTCSAMLSASPVNPDSGGIAATERSCAIRATVLLNPDAAPERSGETLANAVEVTGATTMASPIAKKVTARSTKSNEAFSGEMNDSDISAAARTIEPRVSGIRGP